MLLCPHGPSKGDLALTVIRAGLLSRNLLDSLVSRSITGVVNWILYFYYGPFLCQLPLLLLRLLPPEAFGQRFPAEHWLCWWQPSALEAFAFYRVQLPCQNLPCVSLHQMSNLWQTADQWSHAARRLKSTMIYLSRRRTHTFISKLPQTIPLISS